MSARKFSIGIGLVVFLALAQGAQAGESLYLLAGTSWNQGMYPFGDPVSLYAVSPDRNLKLVRTIASSLFAVQDNMHDKIFVEYPMYHTTTVSVIHEEQPLAKDEVVFNPKGLMLVDTEVALAAGEDDRTYALLPTIRPGESLGSESLVAVAADGLGTPLRVAPASLALYANLRHEGCAGGPAPCVAEPVARVSDGYLVMQVGGKQVKLSTLPSLFQNPSGQKLAAVVAASERFLVFSLLHRHGLTTYYVYDRRHNRWSDFRFSASAPISRLFGSWLASIVEDFHPNDDKGNNNPGREDERDWGTPLLPNVRKEYALLKGMEYSIPGILILTNLVDGRKITLKTHEEDSEILDVSKNGLVLYRVNDEIFSTHIEGDKLSAPKLVVKGEDVPEVHWVFWSNARVSTQHDAKSTR